ncbi:hypothetical protein BVY03_01075, partial [bacterium K02(2017)]
MSTSTKQQTNKTFSYKWNKVDIHGSKQVLETYITWLTQKYFENNENKIDFLKNNKGKTILDAGCGVGLSSMALFGDYLKHYDYTGVDNSDSVNIAQKDLAKLTKKYQIIKDDITEMQLNKKFDYILSEGVIHHTNDPYKTFINLINHLKPQGTILFYVYVQKAPIREYADDLIRKQISELSNEEAWEKLMPLTELGIELGKIKKTINIKKNIDILGIPSGSYDIQRFFYWFFVKAFYNQDFSKDEMNINNFDWYMPQNCARFKPETIISWLQKNNLTTKRFHVEKAGIT